MNIIGARQLLLGTPDVSDLNFEMTLPCFTACRQWHKYDWNQLVEFVSKKIEIRCINIDMFTVSNALLKSRVVIKVYDLKERVLNNICVRFRRTVLLDLLGKKSCCG